MSRIAEVNSANKAIARGKAPEQEQFLPRCSVMFVIDISGSTALEHNGNPPDIDVINDALPKALQQLREAPRGSPIGKGKDRLDVSILAYNDVVTTVLPWTQADQLPRTLPPLIAKDGTSTGHALLAALSRISDYQLKLQANKTPAGRTTVIHITDGGPTDMRPGHAQWLHTQGVLDRVRPGPGHKGSIDIVHMISPNGCDSTFPPNVHAAAHGYGSGLECLSQLTGPQSVVPLNKGIKMMDDFVKLIVGTVLRATVLKQPSAKAGAAAANDVAKSSSPAALAVHGDRAP